jgi:hypothetical protein
MSDEWTVTINLATEELPTEEQLIAMADTAERWDATVSARGRDGNGITFRVDIAASNPTHAIDEAIDLAWKLVHETHIAAEVVGVNAETPELAEIHAFRPDTPELLAATDVAGLLGVSRQRVHQLSTDHRDFPEPYVRLGSGPIWARPAIEHFHRVWQRKPGRPARAS